MISKESFLFAHKRIKPFIHRTPILTSGGIDERAGCEVYFKCENFQKIGAFKARGAINAVLSLPERERNKGVATHSSGNHAQALALAAGLAGVPAFIVMPSNAPEIKKRGVLGLGGKIFECEPNQEARESMLKKVIEKTGSVMIHPFNNTEVITGQGTAFKEMVEINAALDGVIAPVGGGGLLSGTALAASFFSAHTLVYGAEPEGADDAYRSMISGKIEPSQANTIADGLLTSLGDLTLPIIQQEVREILTVSDEEIIAAMRLIWERMKIIVEPSGAVPLAGLLKNREKFMNKKVGIILSGGNVDLNRACQLFQSHSKTMP